MASEHDLKGLMKFADREEWQGCLAAVMDEHFGAILNAGDMAAEDLIDLVGDHWQGVLWGCAFEDFLTLEFDVPGSNIVDEYLKRRGWREKPSAKAYMKALRHSIISLYEVSDVVPGKSMKLQDLVRGGDLVTISEKSATQSLKQWDRIAVRVVVVQGTTIMSGGLLPYTFKGGDMLLDDIRETLGSGKNGLFENASNEELQNLAPMFTLVWLSDLLEGIMLREIPYLSNSDGERVEFHDVRFQFATGISQKEIAKCLNTIQDLQQENTRFWNWLERDNAQKKTQDRQTNGLELMTTLDDGARVLGSIELKGKTLILSVNSADRAKQGQELIEQKLGEMICIPLTNIRTVNQMLADGDGKRSEEPKLNIPPEIAQKLMQQTLDKHYRETLDHPILALDGKTPRQAAKSKKGRKQVTEWLKFLENSSSQLTGSDISVADYDFKWMWEELEIKRPS